MVQIWILRFQYQSLKLFRSIKKPFLWEPNLSKISYDRYQFVAFHQCYSVSVLRPLRQDNAILKTRLCTTPRRRSSRIHIYRNPNFGDHSTLFAFSFPLFSTILVLQYHHFLHSQFFSIFQNSTLHFLQFLQKSPETKIILFASVFLSFHNQHQTRHIYFKSNDAITCWVYS